PASPSASANNIKTDHRRTISVMAGQLREGGNADLWPVRAMREVIAWAKYPCYEPLSGPSVARGLATARTPGKLRSVKLPQAPHLPFSVPTIARGTSRFWGARDLGLGAEGWGGWDLGVSRPEPAPRSKGTACQKVVLFLAEG